MIRFIIVAILLVIFLIVSIPIQLVLLLIGFAAPDVRDKASLHIVNWAFGVCIKLSGIKKTVIGYENVPKDEAVLYVMNHRSIFDIIITYTLMPGLTGFIAKKEMAKYATLSTWMMFLHCEFLDRDNPRKGLNMMKSSVNKIKKGISMAIFPEGTRNKSTEETILEFHKGSFKIAEMAGCRIVPVVLNNTSPIFEDHLPAIKSQHVIIEYMKPIDMTGMGRAEKRELPDKIREQMIQVYNRNQAKI